MERHLRWPNCANVRDLGGLATSDGRRTRRGAVVRADGLDRLTADGWSRLEAYGIRTVVDLRSALERDAEPYTCGLRVLHVPIEDETDEAFVRQWRPFSTPHYYAAALRRWPERTAAAVASVARAEPGGVVVHCGRGRDRTGLVVMLLLALVGVAPGDIAEDYELSERGRPPPDVDTIFPDPFRADGRTRRQIEDDLATERRRRAEATDRDAILAVLASLDVTGYLRAAGLAGDDLAAVRSRLLA